jgi:UDP-2-acetamido-2,6-beta-L-arabino-hexul-4-ose reductase
MKVLVTGVDGFIGRNLALKLSELADVEILPFVRGQGDASLGELVAAADLIVHLAGENRPSDPAAFEEVNLRLTERLCNHLRAVSRRVPVVFSSTTQASVDNPYGRSKLAAERELEEFSHQCDNPLAIFRLPGVFGKWSRPNYNSVVATFCYNKARDLPIQIRDPGAMVRLVYVDDVVDAMTVLLRAGWGGLLRPTVEPEYVISLADLAAQIDAFTRCRVDLLCERVGYGLTRALYSTYVSYLPVERFSYEVPCYKDARGVFVEMLKTQDSGQFSFFTALPGVTRGQHYHHSKTEKFLVIKGHARFGFRHMVTNEIHYIEAHGDRPRVVETVPGWTHDITNIGADDMMVMLWANEVFDRDKPDTVVSKVEL